MRCRRAPENRAGSTFTTCKLMIVSISPEHASGV